MDRNECIEEMEEKYQSDLEQPTLRTVTIPGPEEQWTPGKLLVPLKGRNSAL